MLLLLVRFVFTESLNHRIADMMLSYIISANEQIKPILVICIQYLTEFLIIFQYVVPYVIYEMNYTLFTKKGFQNVAKPCDFFDDFFLFGCLCRSDGSRMMCRCRFVIVSSSMPIMLCAMHTT